MTTDAIASVTGPWAQMIRSRRRRLKMSYARSPPALERSLVGVHGVSGGGGVSGVPKKAVQEMVL